MAGGKMPASVSATVEDFSEPLEEIANAGGEAPLDGDFHPDQLLEDQLGEEFADAASEDLVEDPTPEVEDEPEMDSAVLEGEDKPTEPAEPQGRANTRIRELVEREKAAKAELAAERARAQEYAKAMAEQTKTAYEAQLAEQRKVSEAQARQLELLQGKADREYEANLSPMDKFRLDTIRAAKQEMQQTLTPEIQALKNELAAERKQREALQAKADQEKRLAQFTSTVQETTRTKLLKDFTEEGQGKLAPLMDDMQLSYIAATGDETGARFQEFLDLYYQERLKRASKTGGKKIKQARQIPQTPVSGRRTARAPATPSFETLAANGYHGVDALFDWRDDGSPPLRTPKG
jgi:hypothetical protein